MVVPSQAFAHGLPRCPVFQIFPLSIWWKAGGKYLDDLFPIFPPFSPPRLPIVHEAGQARVNMKGGSFMYEEKRENGEGASIINFVGCRLTT